MFEHRPRLVARAFLLVAVVALAFGAGGAAKPSFAATRHGQGGQQLRVRFLSSVIDLYHPAEITVAGTGGSHPEVRLLGAVDRDGLAYEWTPYPWQRLELLHGFWHGVLPAPPLFGIYQLQLRLDETRKFTSPHWLLRVYPAEAMGRRSFPTALAAIRDFVARLAGMQLVAVRPWRQAPFDHRDPRLNRMFVIAYAPRGDRRPDSRLGLFVTTVRDGFHGRWRLLTATTRPYD